MPNEMQQLGVSHCPSRCSEANMWAATYLPGHCKTHLMKYEKCVCVCSKKQTVARVRSHWSHPTDTTVLSSLKKHKSSSCASSEHRGPTQRCICCKMNFVNYLFVLLRRDDWIYNGWHDMFSFWSSWCHETSVRQEHSWPSISGQPHLLFWRAIKCCWLPLLHFVDLPPEPLFAHRQNSSEAPEITITAHTRSRSTLSELLLGANQLNAPPSSSHNTNSNF